MESSFFTVMASQDHLGIKAIASKTSNDAPDTSPKFCSSFIIDRLCRELAQLLSQDQLECRDAIFSTAQELSDLMSPQSLQTIAPLLIKTCTALFQINRSTDAIHLGRQIADRATQYGDIQIQRRIFNVLGSIYGDVADFTAAMQCLQQALALAKNIGDPVIEAACLANVATLMQEMGHYRQAISLCRQVLSLQDDSGIVKGLKTQCSSTGLFSAHRIGDAVAASYFLEQGQQYVEFAFGELGRAFFEKDRALYLIDCNRESEASTLIDSASGRAAASTIGINNQRVRTLLTISRSLCDWALGQKDRARDALKQQYVESNRTRLYHHWVLQALIKVHGDAVSPEDVVKGLTFARELVEYTTSVKKAKFYRQLASRRSGPNAEDNTDPSRSEVDPFAVAKDWLRDTDIAAPGLEVSSGEKVELAKHEELTVIHEDMARLRARSIRREIRTDAVDTAENWAIAAEFFDDETGQHCFRVGHLAAMLAREIGMSETFCVQVEHAARLHDIGKIAVNEVILLKPGPLDAAEMAAMRLHTEVGAQILSGSDDPTLRMATDIARHHHEWWSGGGYPSRLAGKGIPMSARVCAYADVYDALTHARSYKRAWPHERALEEMVRLKGTQFDPDLMDAFTRVLDRYQNDLASASIPGFVDMDSNTLIASRKKLMETITG